MAQSVFHRPHPVRIRPAFSWSEFARWFRIRCEWTLRAARRDPRLFLWTVLWLPFWLGSDAPQSRLPGRNSTVVSQTFTDPAGLYIASRMQRVTQKFSLVWFAGSLLRGVTLAMLVITLWTLLALAVTLDLPGWGSIVAIVGCGVIAGGIHGWLIRPNRLMVAGMLDHTFGLEERIITAFDRPNDASHVSRLQLADAANTFDEILSEVPRSAFLPVREAAICLIVAATLLTALLANVPRQSIAAAGDSPVPQFVLASERLAVRENTIPQQPLAEQPTADRATIAEIQERGRNSQSAREDLARIGDALQDHPITQPAADAIANGDYAMAADSLRSASESAGAMDQASRDALADDLEQAASDVSESNPDLAQAANEAADALREGGQEAESALSDLASQVDETGGKVESQEDLARDLDEAQSGSSDPATSGSEGSEGSQSNSSQPDGSSEQQSGDQGEGSDPGEGSAAQPGVSDQPQQSSEDGQPGSESSSGSAEQGAGSGSPSESEGEPPADAQQGSSAADGSGQGAESEGGESSSTSPNNQGIEGAPEDETSASQGSGAGTGQRGANDQSTSDQSVDDPADPQPENPDAEIPSEGQAGDPPPSRSDRGEEDDSRGSTNGGSSTLEIQGTSDEGVQMGGDSGSSSLGSGSGATTASGDQAQGDVGVSGPDSNSVPDSLRDVVKDYFGGPEE